MNVSLATRKTLSLIQGAERDRELVSMAVGPRKVHWCLQVSLQCLVGQETVFKVCFCILWDRKWRQRRTSYLATEAFGSKTSLSNYSVSASLAECHQHSNGNWSPAAAVLTNISQGKRVQGEKGRPKDKTLWKTMTKAMIWRGTITNIDRMNLIDLTWMTDVE